MKTRILLALVIAVLSIGAVDVFAAPGHLEGYVPAAANAAGRFDSYWTTDLWIYQQGATVIHMWYNPAGQDNTDNTSVVVPLDGPVVHLSDVVGNLFEGEGIGSIHYLADGPVTVVSRTWTSSPEGGSYGQTIPGQPLGNASFAGTGQGGALRMLVNQQPGFRPNLGLVNVSPLSITVAVEIFTADGEPAPGDSSFSVDLAPFDMTQLNDILQRLPPGQREGLIVRTGVTSADGAIMAYISEVDNSTNDASYQEGFRFAF
ncbi:MAG: hypothetical protein KAI97_05965 [Gemmatimonadetes bacterium]|nr:hypothetical protein [Gemmatimonadota bacterium]